MLLSSRFLRRCSGLRWELAELEEQTEPVLHVPGAGNAITCEGVKFVEAEADLFSRGCDTEEFTLMRAADLRAHTDSARLLDHVVDGDPDIGERLLDAADDGFDARGTGSLARIKRNVVPVRRKNVIHKVKVLLSECAVEVFHRLPLSAKAIGEVSVGEAHCLFHFRLLTMLKFWRWQ